MTAKELEQKQKGLWKEIWNKALSDGLITGQDSDNAWPIYDGVSDIQGYLSSNPRIMFILKEAYDDTTESEAGEIIPYGGDWSMPELFKECSQKGKWPVTTWQRVIYAIYGAKHGLKYNEMDYVKNDPEMGNVLLSTCWINLNKMPGLSTSDNSRVRDEALSHWIDIVKKQIDIYDPEIIVFGGTLFKDDEFYYQFLSQEDWNNRIPVEGDDFLVKYIKDGRVILDAKHPGLRKDVERWVNSLIHEIQSFKK